MVLWRYRSHKTNDNFTVYLTIHDQFVEEIEAVKMADTDKSCLITEKKVNSKSQLKKDFKCDICDVKLATLFNLEKHIKIHTGERSFQCDYCEKKFARKSNLNEHLKVHTREKPFQCDFCEKKFTQKNNLNRHLKVHTGEKSFQCEYCEKKFTLKQNLTRHLKIHTRKLDD